MVGELAAPVLAGGSREGGRVLTGHPTEVPQLDLPKNTSEQNKHLGEPCGGLQSHAWCIHFAHFATKAGGHPGHTRSTLA